MMLPGQKIVWKALQVGGQGPTSEALAEPLVEIRDRNP